MTRSLRLLVGALFVAFALLVAALVPADAARPAAQGIEPGSAIAVSGRYYGAIALSRADGAVGWSYNFKTKRKAGKRALRECKDASDTPWSCKKIAWVRNGCLALAVRWNSNGTIARYAWGLGRNKRPAYENALRKCGSKCKRRAYTCTAR
ncbi:MAG: DUF4189 domain-containing protein [Candidatus Nanopelagicales bacterium]